MSFRNCNSFDGVYCYFNNTNFKRVFKQYCEKTGYTQISVKKEIEEKYGIPIDTISNWMKNTKPVDGVISKDGKLNEDATIVKLARYFNVDVKELLKFNDQEGEKRMNLVKEQIRKEEKETYNQSQIRTLHHLNDVVMEYMIFKCHTMDNFADSTNFMEHFDYSIFIDNNFKTYKGIDENTIKLYHKEKTKEEKEKEKEAEIERIKNMIEEEKPIFQALWKNRLKNIDKWMIEKEQMQEKDNALIKKYDTTDTDFAQFLDDICQDNAAYGYVLFEIEKASPLLRKGFIYDLENALRQLYEIYENGFMGEGQSVESFASNPEEKKLFKTISTTDYVKYLFAKEFSLYC